MKKYVTSLAIAAAAFATPALAQDFQGFYAGVEGGFDNYEVKVDDIDLTDVVGFDATGSFDGLSGNGVMGGVFAGYHVTMDTTFIAVEGFAQLSDASVSISATDGVDEIDANIKATIDDGVDAYSDSESEDAIQYGVGLETMIAESVSLRAEYLRASYGDQGVDGLSIDNNNFKAGLAFRF